MKDKDFELPPPEILAEPVQPEAAIAFWAWKAGMPYEEVKKLADAARDRAFYVTGLAEHDAVQGVKDALGKALEDGETFADFQGRIAEVIASQGWKGDRIETIFRNNLQTAYSAGRYAKMQGVKKARPYWQYMTVGDERVRPSHAILNNKVFHADHEFWNENYPPNGHKCRCVVRTLSERQVENEGLEVEKAMPGDDMYTDPKTGMEYHVAKPGADDGWRSNPGKAWVEGDPAVGLPLEKYPDLAKQRLQRNEGRDIVDPIEKAVGAPKGEPKDILQAGRAANPRFFEGKQYQENCQRCVPAAELISRGYDVEAMPHGRKGPVLVGHECFEGAQVVGKKFWGGDGRFINKAELIKQIGLMPDGARVGVIWQWAGQRGAHTVVCVKKEGNLHFFDPQTGKECVEMLDRASKAHGFTFYRMDNLNIKPVFNDHKGNEATLSDVARGRQNDRSGSH